jgi:hypothetical protein
MSIITAYLTSSQLFQVHRRSRQVVVDGLQHRFHFTLRNLAGADGIWSSHRFHLVKHSLKVFFNFQSFNEAFLFPSPMVIDWLMLFSTIAVLL